MKWTLWSSATGSHGARWLIRLVALDDTGTQFLKPPQPPQKKVMHSRISCLNYNLHISSLPMRSTIIRLRLCIWSAMQIDNYIAQFCKHLRKETCDEGKLIKDSFMSKSTITGLKIQVAWEAKRQDRYKWSGDAAASRPSIQTSSTFCILLLTLYQYNNNNNGYEWLTDDYMYSKAYSNKFILKVFIPIRSNNKNIDDWWSFMI